MICIITIIILVVVVVVVVGIPSPSITASEVLRSSLISQRIILIKLRSREELVGSIVLRKLTPEGFRPSPCWGMTSLAASPVQVCIGKEFGMGNSESFPGLQ